MKTPKPATTYPAIVGQVLKRLRDKCEINQRDLVDSLGLTQSAWSRIERGETALTIEQLAIAASALGVTSAHVLQLSDEAVRQAERQGITVMNKRPQNEEDVARVLLGVAVVALIVTALFSKK